MAYPDPYPAGTIVRQIDDNSRWMVVGVTYYDSAPYTLLMRYSKSGNVYGKTVEEGCFSMGEYHVE